MPPKDLKDYPPLKDLVNTYLPDEAMKELSRHRVFTCPKCGYQLKAVIGQPDPPCPRCQLKDKYL